MNPTHEWHPGKNIGRIVDLKAGIPKDKSKHYTIYKLIINNLHGKQLELRYLVPNDKQPTDQLKGLLDISRMKPRPWLYIFLQEDEHSHLLKISGIDEIREKTQEEVEMQSLEERGGRVTLN